MKPKKCKNCSKEFTPIRSSLEKVCSYQCAIKLAEVKVWQEENKIIDQKVKDIKRQLGEKNPHRNLQDQINRIVRLIDKGHPCITSGREIYFVHAGHLIPTGRNKTLTYNLLNIYAQSDEQNKHKHGNEGVFWERIHELFGEEVVEEIKGLVAKYPVIHLSKLEMKEKTAIARKIANRLEKEDKIYTLKERIELRRKFNEEIGIYKFENLSY